MPPEDVFGLILTDSSRAEALITWVDTNDLLETLLAASHGITDEIEFIDQVVDTLESLVKAIHVQEPGKLNGLRPEEQVIFTNEIATGSFDLQRRLFALHRDGYKPDYLIP